jgi:hypothetical protein
LGADAENERADPSPGAARSLHPDRPWQQLRGGRPNGTHLRLIGSPEQRAAHLAEAHGWSPPDARQHLERTDAARRRYVQRTFGRAIDDPLGYDAIINTDLVPLVEAAQWIAHRVRRHEPVPAF